MPNGPITGDDVGAQSGGLQRAAIAAPASRARRIIGHFFNVVTILSFISGSVTVTCMIGWLYLHKGLVAAILGAVLCPFTAIVFPIFAAWVAGAWWPLLFYAFVLLGMMSMLISERCGV